MHASPKFLLASCWFFTTKLNKIKYHLPNAHNNCSFNKIKKKPHFHLNTQLRKRDMFSKQIPTTCYLHNSHKLITTGRPRHPKHACYFTCCRLRVPKNMNKNVEAELLVTHLTLCYPHAQIHVTLF